jgi:hypothetical protein
MRELMAFAGIKLMKNFIFSLTKNNKMEKIYTKKIALFIS